MSNIRELERGRLAGLEMALKIVRDGGVEALEKECKARGAYNIQSNYTYTELVKMSERVIVGTKQRAINTILAMSVHTLQDEFGFGHVRLERFVKRFLSKTEGMLNGEFFWEDLEELLDKEVKIKINLSDFENRGRTEEEAKKLYKRAKNMKKI